MTMGCGRQWPYLCLVVVVQLLTACVAGPKGPIRLDMRYAEGAIGQSFSPASSVCTVKIDSVTDARVNKLSLGYIDAKKSGTLFPSPYYGAVPIYGEEVEDYVRHALRDLQVFGYNVVEANTALQPVVHVDVNLNQINIRSVNATLVSAVRLTVRYARSNGVVVERSYRGSYVNVGWVTAANLIMGTLNHAMIGAVRKIAKDLPEMCGI